MNWLRGDRRPHHRTGRTTAHQRRAALPALHQRPADPVGTRPAAHRARPCRHHGDGAAPSYPMRIVFHDAHPAARRAATTTRRHHRRDRNSVATQGKRTRVPAYRDRYQPAGVHGAPLASPPTAHPSGAASTATGHNGCWRWTLTRSRRCAEPAPCCITLCRSWRQPRTGSATDTASATRRGP